MTTTNDDIRPAVERAKREILADIEAGKVPATVAGFAELHDHVDANEYGGACEGGWWDGTEAERLEAMEFWDRVQDRVDQWLKAGRP
jgi:hypothetical protein